MPWVLPQTGGELAPATEQVGRAEPHAESSGRAEFVEVVAPARGAAVCEQLEVVLESGVVVRVPARFDADALRRVVAALGGA